MRNARPAAEIDPDRAISSSTAIFPGPMRRPPARSILIFRRSPSLVDSSDFGFFFGMTRYPNTTSASEAIIHRAGQTDRTNLGGIILAGMAGNALPLAIPGFSMTPRYGP